MDTHYTRMFKQICFAFTVVTVLFLPIIDGGLVETVIQIFVSFNWASFWGLFIPSTVTVGGSFFIYKKKENKRSERVRAALIAELEQMETWEHIVDELEKEGCNPEETEEKIPAKLMPPASQISTKVYSSNTDKLGRLTQGEVKHIVRFYTDVLYIKDLIDGIGSDDDLPLNAHKVVYRYIRELSEDKGEVVRMLKKEKDPNDVEILTGNDS